MRIADDIELVKDLLDLTTSDLARATKLGTATLERWQAGTVTPNEKSLSAFYDYAFSQGLRINEIKGQLHREQLEARGLIALFHGAKTSIDGPLSLERSKPNNDFGRGFYCGEKLEQPAMFVAGYPDSSLYILEFDPTGLKQKRFQVNQEWMLTVALFRGKLREFERHPSIAQLKHSVAETDYIVAPIADNRMFEIIDSFIDGEITDVQCEHCLSATNLGKQYVLVSDAALSHARIAERCYLAPREKEFYLTMQRSASKTGSDKVKIARRQFRGQGLYIEEILS